MDYSTAKFTNAEKFADLMIVAGMNMIKEIMDITSLKSKVHVMRQDLIRMLVTAGSGHTAGPLGLAEIYATLFFGGVMNYDPQNPSWEERDRVVVSNGHVCPILYVAMAHAGYFPVEELSTLRKLDSRLQGHPHRLSLPGIETTSGPLGCGLSQAAGMALGGRLDKKSWHVFCLASDGEHDEGNFWEGVMFAAKYKLANLTVIVDRNNIQIDGFTSEVMPLDPLVEKYTAFNWRVKEIDGHDPAQIHDALSRSDALDQLPLAIIAKTVPGKGVSFIENLPEWHGKVPSKTELEAALQELTAE